ncbi:MAG: SDR family NAD(P)-dependent oxidoreductase [Hydrogenophaga sp.]|nr:SDR family NAD(P)-dependent oxidoreductase [Hydrogenophaga sp.]
MGPSEKFPAHAMAIVGMAGRFPGASDLEAFWRNIREGVESLEPFSDADLHGAGVDPALSGQPQYVRQGTVLENADHFDAGFFGMSPREAQVIDPQQRIFLECAWEALEHAGYAPGAIAQAVGVYAGASMNTYLLSQILRDPALAASVGGYQLMLGNDKDFLCTRVSYKLDLHGPSMTLQTACSTSLVAVQVACRALERHECDIALAGGVSVNFPQRGGYLFQEGMILSPDGHCRPFDADAKGTRPGAGAGIVVLKRLADALADGDTIHAVIRGAAINNDGAGKAGYTAPSVDGQVEAIATAQMLADVDPRSIGYLEAHGTATPLGDPIEIAALRQVFEAGTADQGFCRLGSLKANLGHLDAAAGVAGLIKTVLALQHRELPPLVNFRQANPQLGLDASPFTASAQAAPWLAEGAPRRAGVSSFGIGGTNAHVVLEEAPEPVRAPASGQPQLLVLSARSEAALEAATQRLREHLAGPGAAQDLRDPWLWTLQQGRRAFAHRRTVVAATAADGGRARRAQARAGHAHGRHEGGEARGFPVSAGRAASSPAWVPICTPDAVYRDAIDRCAELLRAPMGRDLREVLFAPAGDLTINETRYAQPALFVTEYALAMLWQSWGVRPAAMLGHSIGEYVAAHLAGVMSLADALTLVAARGQLMQGMAPGGMAAVQLSASELQKWLVTPAGTLEIAAVNAPGLCAISGPHEALEACLRQLKEQGIDAQPLHTSHAFHSSMMDGVLAPFTALVEKMALAEPGVPYVSNVTGQWITPAQATSPAYYAEHLRRAVLFEAGVRTLAADPSMHLLEVGPGRSLATLAGMALGVEGVRRTSLSMGQARDARQGAHAVLEAAARLWLAGVSLDWAGLHGPVRPARVPLPTYPFERKRHAVDPVAPKAAPPKAAAPVGETGVQRPVEDWFWAPSWQRAGALPSGLAPSTDAPGRWLVFRGDDAAAQALAGALAGPGVEVVSVTVGAAFRQVSATHFEVAPGSQADHDQLFSALGTAPLACVLHAWNAAPDAPLAAPALDAALPQGRSLAFDALICLARALGGVARAQPLPVLVLSSDREPVLGTESVRPERALLLGPALLLPLDVPGVHCRAIDLAGTEWTAQAAPRLAAALRAEAARPDPDGAVAYRGRHRWTPSLIPQRLGADAGALPLREGGTYLVTGGAGGIGLTLGQWLARNARASRLVLVSRSAWPERAQWDGLLAAQDTPAPQKERIAGIRAMEAAGAEVLLCSADVADEAQMQAVVAMARARFGAVHGVVHAAGALGSGTVFEKTAQGIEAVLRPKLEGTLVLDRVLAGAGLDFFMMCSSISTAFGSAGMADYSAANAFQDAFAKSGLARSSERVLAVGWDSWRDVGFAALQGSDGSHAALRYAIRPEEGADAFGRALASGLPHVYVTRQVMPDMLRDVEALKAWLRTSGQAAQAAPAEPGSAAPVDLQAMAPSEIEGRIGAIWSELLGVDDIGLDDDFFALGGHSLMATRIIARIEEQFGARLSLRDLFEGPSIRQLAAKVAAQAASNGRKSGQPDGGAGDEDREEIEF